jgi:hypothetical protein
MIQLPVVLLNTHDDTQPTSFIDIVAMTFWALGFLIEAMQNCRPRAAWDSVARGYRAAWDTVPRGIPCRVGYRAVWDTVPRGIRWQAAADSEKMQFRSVPANRDKCARPKC